VSDFYIPDDKLPEDKIQSSSGGINLQLDPVLSFLPSSDLARHGPLLTGSAGSLRQVPKLLGRIRAEWAPEAFVVSFKLETDESILLRKSRAALEKYRVNLVVANVLDTRYERVSLLGQDFSEDIFRADGAPIEEALVARITALHETYLHGH